MKTAKGSQEVSLSAMRNLCAFILLFVAASLFAQSRPIRFERLSLDQGLSQSTVMCVLQDKRGFMWFGTEAGLNRYDGRNLTVYRHDVHDLNSLPSDFVWQLAEDASGDIWVATDGGGLARWEHSRDRFVRYSTSEGPGSSQLRTVYVDRKGLVWVGTKDAGLARLDPKSGKWKRFTNQPNRPSSLVNNGIFTLYEDSGGLLWVGTNAGLASFDPATEQFKPFRHDPNNSQSLSDDRIRDIGEDREGRIWIATFGGGIDILQDVNRFEHLRSNPTNPAGLADDVVHAMMEDSAGRFWVGTRSGLQLRKPDGTFITYRHDPAEPHSLGDDDVLSLYEDRSGVLWFGTRAGGVSRFSPRTWDFGYVPAAPSDPNGLASGYVTSFAMDSSGNLWIGTMGGGLHVLDRTNGKMRRYKRGEAGLSDDRVMALLHGHNGVLWVGTMEGGLNRFDNSTARFQVFQNDTSRPGSLSANGIMSLFEDSRGVLWIGTFGGGLNRLVPGETNFSVFKHNSGDSTSISGDIVTALAEDSSGGVWVGTENEGLNRFDLRRGIFQHFRHDATIPTTIADDTIYSLEVDRHGTLWVGTRSGLSKLESLDSASGEARFRTYTGSDGLAGNVVYGIESDTKGSLWLSGSQGLLLLDPVNSEFRQYTASQGLQGNEFNFGAHYRSPVGELFFGGPAGFNAFQPEQLEIDTTVPPVILVGFYKFNRPVPELGPPYQLQSLNLDYRDALVTLEFAALDYAAPERNRYSYQLEGFENEWIDLGFERRITFTNLGSGNYTLHVRASNSDGVWNQHGFSIPMRVAPAPWRSPLAYTFYSLILALGAILVVRRQHLKSTRAAEYQSRLEHDVRSRTEELSKKNEELGNLNAQLMELSLTDALTGLRNRRYLFEHVGKEVNYVQREHRGVDSERHQEGMQLVLIMVDLDDFKPINDSRGHMVGDHILIQVRQVLQDACRASDVLVRWGGDEFLVIGRTPNAHMIQSIPERICSMIEATYFDLGDGQVGRLTCSIGFTCYPGGLRDLEWPSLELLVTLSDRALYIAKKSGRNRWVGLVGTPQTDAATLIPLLQEDPEKLVESGCVEVRMSDREQRRISLQSLQGKKSHT